MIGDLALDPEYIIEMRRTTFLARKTLNIGLSHWAEDGTGQGNVHVGTRMYLKSTEMKFTGSHD